MSQLVGDGVGTWERERLELTLKCLASAIDGPGALTGRRVWKRVGWSWGKIMNSAALYIDS